MSLKFSFTLNKEQRRAHQPSKIQLGDWLKRSLIQDYTLVHVDINIVSVVNSKILNKQYRDIDSPTNVISLEYASSREEYGILYGELVLCDDIIVKEAKEQNKTILAHYAHMLIHGALHLQGLDHRLENEAQIMEGLEIQIMHGIGFSNPYES